MTPRSRLDPQAVDDFFRSLWIHVEPEPLFASVLTRINEIAGCERSALLLLDASRGDYCLQQATGDWQPSFVEARWPPEQGLTRWLAINSRPLLTRLDLGAVASIAEEQRLLLAGSAVEAVVPLTAAGRLIGFFALGATRQARSWTRELAHLIATLAVPAALAFEHVTLVSEERLRLRRLYRAERLATAGTLATGLAHEIRNPLTAIRSGMQLLRDRQDMPADATEILGEAIDEVDRIDRLVGGLVMFARGPRPDLKSTDLVDVVLRSIALVASRARAKGISIESELPEHPVPVHGDAGQLEQVTLNLLLNAVEACDPGGAAGQKGTEAGMPATSEQQTIAVQLLDHSAQAAADGRVELQIRDRGVGLPDGASDQIFDPFFTTKPEGTGLGLSISYHIVARHGGELILESRNGGGAVAHLILPPGRSEPQGW